MEGVHRRGQGLQSLEDLQRQDHNPSQGQIIVYLDHMVLMSIFCDQECTKAFKKCSSQKKDAPKLIFSCSQTTDALKKKAAAVIENN